MTDSIIERVARAIWTNQRNTFRLPLVWSGLSAAKQRHWRNHAKIAIASHKAALHEAGYVIVPRIETDKMDEAGTEAYLKISGWNCSVQVVAETIWRAMIAAAEDEPSPNDQQIRSRNG